MAKTPKTSQAAKSASLSADLKLNPKDRRGDFVRLANSRTFNAVKAIQLIGNLSNVNDYEFTEADVSQIVEAIESELAATKSRFKVSRQKAERRPINLTL